MKMKERCIRSKQKKKFICNNNSDYYKWEYRVIKNYYTTQPAFLHKTGTTTKLLLEIEKKRNVTSEILHQMFGKKTSENEKHTSSKLKKLHNIQKACDNTAQQEPHTRTHHHSHLVVWLANRCTTDGSMLLTKGEMCAMRKNHHHHHHQIVIEGKKNTYTKNDDHVRRILYLLDDNAIIYDTATGSQQTDALRWWMILC